MPEIAIIRIGSRPKCLGGTSGSFRKHRPSRAASPSYGITLQGGARSHQIPLSLPVKL